jgi:hypothetical protein
MAAQTYSDLFTYDSFEFCGKVAVSYKNVTLLKDVCGKKVGSKIEEIRLDTTNGKFTVPRRKSIRLEETAAANTLVEFKGVHTRFPDTDEPVDEEDVSIPAPKAQRKKKATTALSKTAAVLDKGETSSRPNNISGMIGLRIYENKRRKLLRVESVDDHIAREIHNQLRKEMRAVTSDMSMGSRGELTFTFQTSTMECIPEMKTLTEFIVIGCRYYYMRLV